MNKAILPIIVIAALVIAIIVVTRKPQTPSQPSGGKEKVGPPAGQPMLASVKLMGNELYASQCATCHGEEGAGNGPAAEYLFPAPRDFTKARYKIRSTPGGELPTDDDLFRTITRGIPGSAMPSFEFLGEEQRKSLLSVLKSFAMVKTQKMTFNRFEKYGAPQPIQVSEAPAESPELVAGGQAVYKKMGCANCHGDTGIGNGPAAAGLKDESGWPIPPANFARGIFKGGDSVKDIYLRFTTGMNGTPMPSYSDTLPDKDRWALAYYVKSLVRKEKSLVHSSYQTIRAANADGEIPLDSSASTWSKATPVDVPLMATWQRPEAPKYLTARALHSGEKIGFLLEWNDPTVDGSAIHHRDFSDAAALMFSLTQPEGHFTMGEKGKPVNLWQWRFNRQVDLARFADVESAYPWMAVDDYPFAAVSMRKALPEGRGSSVLLAASHDATYLTGWGAANSLSSVQPVSAVEDLNAEGFGTLTSQPPSDQNVEGRGVWAAGVWKVVFRRSLQGSAQDTAFSPGGDSYVAFAAWDGSAGDRDGKKLVTFWQTLKLEQAGRASH